LHGSLVLLPARYELCSLTGGSCGPSPQHCPPHLDTPHSLSITYPNSNTLFPQVGEKRPREEEAEDVAAEEEEQQPDAAAEARAAREEILKPIRTAEGAVKLGPKTFKNGDEAVGYFAKLLSEARDNRELNEYESRVLWDLLCYGHADPQKKVAGGAVGFTVRK
jgi:hypothetical protein